MMPYRILLADDHVIFREMIKKNLSEIPGLEVVGGVSDGLELLKSLETLHPHLIILDIGMPHLSGLQAASKIKPSHPDIKILLLTMFKTKDHLARAMEAGVDGYLLKENAFTDLISAIETIRQGKPYVSNLVAHQILDSFLSKSKRKESELLSPREKEVLKCLADGMPNKEIADALFISESTVRVHFKNIKKKLIIKTNIDLLRYALKYGYAS
jgi:DNA-binding NarL/FixJ family response regulator